MAVPKIFSQINEFGDYTLIDTLVFDSVSTVEYAGTWGEGSWIDNYTYIGDGDVGIAFTDDDIIIYYDYSDETLGKAWNSSSTKVSFSYSSAEKSKLTERFGTSCTSTDPGLFALSDLENFYETTIFEGCYSDMMVDLVDRVQTADLTVRYIFKQADVSPFSLDVELGTSQEGAERMQSISPTTTSTTTMDGY